VIEVQTTAMQRAWRLGIKPRLRGVDTRLFQSGDRFDVLLREWLLTDCRSVLDVGCGEKGTLVRRVPGIEYAFGVDLKIPSEDADVPRHAAYRELDVRSIASHFEPRSFDCVIALDLIEHLTRTDGERLLDGMERIARKRVIVFTPNGFLHQPPAPDNPYQEHLSGWRIRDFKRRGYDVVGINGWRRLRGPYARLRWCRPEPLWWRLSNFSQLLVESHPRWAFQLLCRKEISTTHACR
jgi:SAM-dependent methyltransferase